MTKPISDVYGKLPLPFKLSAAGSSDNVAKLFSITTYVRGVHASE